VNRSLIALPQIAALGLLLHGCASPIVGAECKKGMTSCSGLCVDVDNDAENCGACGHSCADGECKRGVCGAGSASDGGFSLSDGGGIGVPTTSGGVGRPFPSDGGLTFPDPAVALSCQLGETACGDSCSYLPEDPAHCGDCETRCAVNQLCSMGECVKGCEGVFMACAGGCADVTASENHCGKCSTHCASGICDNGTCADAIPGHLVVYGHDFFAGSTITMKRLAGDGLFQAAGAPVRTLVYHGSAGDAQIKGIDAAFDYVALEGRSWEAIEAVADDVPQQLRAADAFVIYPQNTSTDAELLELGRNWGKALTQFLLRGGVVLLFETADPSNTGTFHVLEPSGLFTAKSRARIPIQVLDTVGVGFGAATRATRQYASTGTSVHFNGVTSPGNILVEDQDKKPVVVQRIVTE
jgi:hypothetical protein